MKRSERISAFVDAIWQWYARHKRDLPWRDLQIADDDQRAYQVLVSEIMLQQTQVPRVVVKYKEWLEVFPTLHDLAVATNREVIMAWQGMGYNSRALRLRDAARTIALVPTFPQGMDELQKIPGIGHYTAAAIRNFAFSLPTPCLDTNIRRILHRTFIGPERADGTWEKDDRYLLQLAKVILDVAIEKHAKPTPAAAEWHAALMDFGSLVCTKRNPRWDICPLTAKGLCQAAYRVPTQSAPRKREPGRQVGAQYIPNRIFRGRIVEALRHAPAGLPLETIGQHVCTDWSAPEHKQWLQGLLQRLVADQLLTVRRGQYTLKD